MPECPEVHKHRDYIESLLKNVNIIDMKILSGKYQRTGITNYDKFIKVLPKKVKGVYVRGKFMWIELTDNWYIGIGYGMTGRFTEDKTDKYNRISLICDNEITVYYSDMRNFGSINLWNDIKDLNKKLDTLGPDIIDIKMTKKDFIEKIREYDDKEINIPLMNQKVISGVGNYIKSDSLYMTGIYPKALIKNLSDKDLYDLYKNIIIIAKRSYNTQKTQDNDEYIGYSIIYGRDKDKHGNKIKKINTADKRKTSWVPEIQIKGLIS